jgi:hypothetical protein
MSNKIDILNISIKKFLKISFNGEDNLIDCQYKINSNSQIFDKN